MRIFVCSNLSGAVIRLQPVVRSGRGHVCPCIAPTVILFTNVFPGANVSQENSSTNRTAWPLDGGSVVLSSSHESVITYVNLGLGDEVTGFNVSLLAAYNATGNGTICFPQIGGDVLSSLNLTDGQTASLQVVHIGDSGNALYNVRLIPNSALMKCMPVLMPRQ